MPNLIDYLGEQANKTAASRDSATTYMKSKLGMGEIPEESIDAYRKAFENEAMNIGSMGVTGEANVLSKPISYLKSEIPELASRLKGYIKKIPENSTIGDLKDFVKSEVADQFFASGRFKGSQYTFDEAMQEATKYVERLFSDLK